MSAGTLDIFDAAAARELRDFLNAGAVDHLEVRSSGSGKNRQVTVTVVHDASVVLTGDGTVRGSQPAPGGS